MLVRRSRSRWTGMSFQGWTRDDATKVASSILRDTQDDSQAHAHGSTPESDKSPMKGTGLGDSPDQLSVAGAGFALASPSFWGARRPREWSTAMPCLNGGQRPAALSTRSAVTVSIGLGRLGAVDDVGAHPAGRRPPPPCLWLPAAIGPVLCRQMVERVHCPWVGGVARGGDDGEAGHYVVVPVRRVHDVHPPRVDRLAAAGASEHAVCEEELNGPLRGGARLGVTGRLCVLVKPPRGAVKFMERRTVTPGLEAAVPAAVWPLPRNDGLGQLLRAVVVGEPKPGARAEDVAVDARMRQRKPADATATLSEVAADPPRHVVRRSRDTRVVGGCPELGQRHQSPVRTGPLALGLGDRSRHLTLSMSVRQLRRGRRRPGHPSDGRATCSMNRSLLQGFNGDVYAERSAVRDERLLLGPAATWYAEAAILPISPSVAL